MYQFNDTSKQLSINSLMIFPHHSQHALKDKAYILRILATRVTIMRTSTKRFAAVAEAYYFDLVLIFDTCTDIADIGR